MSVNGSIMSETDCAKYYDEGLFGDTKVSARQILEANAIMSNKISKSVPLEHADKCCLTFYGKVLFSGSADDTLEEYNKIKLTRVSPRIYIPNGTRTLIPND